MGSLLSLFGSASSAAGPVLSGLGGRYLFDEGTGTTLTDSSVNSNDGTLQAATEDPAWADGGLVFDGDDFVVLPNVAGLAPTSGGLTLTVAFKDVLGSEGGLEINPFYGMHSTNADPGYYINGPFNDARVALWDELNRFRYWEADTPIEVNAGPHIMVMSIPGSAGADVTSARCIVDGSAQTIFTTTSTDSANRDINAPRIGAAGSERFTGTLGYFAVHNRQLTPAEELQMRADAISVLALRPKWGGLLSQDGTSLLNETGFVLKL